jgi:hypothetical protein
MKGKLVASVGVAVLLSCIGGAPARAAANLVMNGNFSTTSLGASGGQIIGSSSVTGWTNAPTSNFTGYGYTFLATGTSADTSPGMPNNASGYAMLYGPDGGTGASNYSANGLTSSPDGGNYIIADGDPAYSGTLSQTVTGLTVGQAYVLSFYWATAEFAPLSTPSATTEAWDVSFGSQAQATQTRTTAAKGFDPWLPVSMTFAATSTSQVLSFLAAGSPSGEPPALLLDGVSLVAAPEPSTLAVYATGLLMGGLLVRRRVRRAGTGRTG